MLAAIVSLTLSIGAAGWGPVTEPAFIAVAEPDGNIFPSLVVAQSTMTLDPDEEADPTALGDQMGLLGVGVKAPSDHAKVRVTISSPDIMYESTFTGELAAEGVVYSISPKIKWKYRELLKNRQQVPVDVTYRVSIDGGIADEIVKTCTLRSVNDCPHRMLIGDEIRDTKWMFAAYVNEDHPWVDQLLKDALATGVVKAFYGYQSKKPEDVVTQVYAVWRVLQERGIRYSDIASVSAASPRIASQHVRFLDESVSNKQANCVDGSVIFASVLRKIGLECRLVIVPGHCFVALDLDAEGQSTIGLETTLLGAAAKDDFEKMGVLEKLKLDTPTFEQASWATFDHAVEVASKRLKDDKDKFADENEPDYVLVSISEARRAGVKPMPYVPTPTPEPEKSHELLDKLKIK